jgi:3'-phosphoadenosine 5'-phosphosulfate sulfotransferase (PAPS reductase)/FAD synthetase
MSKEHKAVKKLMKLLLEVYGTDAPLEPTLKALHACELPSAEGQGKTSTRDHAHSYPHLVEEKPEKPWTQRDWHPDLLSYDYILINSSGGKDSQALLIDMVERADAAGVPRTKLIVVHADLGRVEWEGTTELAEVQARHFGLEFVKVRKEHKDGESYDLLDQIAARFDTLTANAEALAELRQNTGVKTWREICYLGKEKIQDNVTDRAAGARLYTKAASTSWSRKEKNPRPEGDQEATISTIPWPSSAARYCTSDQKVSPIGKFVTTLHNRHGREKPMRVLNTLGIRAQESSARAKKRGFGPKGAYQTSGTAKKGKRTVDEWYPIFGWGETQVWDTIKSPGAPPYHKAYDLGMRRLSCVFCVFATEEDLTTAAKHNPKLFSEYVELEKRVGHTFQQNRSLQTLAKTIAEKELVPDKVPSLLDLATTKTTTKGGDAGDVADAEIATIK